MQSCLAALFAGRKACVPPPPPKRPVGRPPKVAKPIGEVGGEANPELLDLRMLCHNTTPGILFLGFIPEVSST